MLLHQINEEIENILQKLINLNAGFFNVGKKYSYKLREEKIKLEKRLNFLKCMKKIYIMKK